MTAEQAIKLEIITEAISLGNLDNSDNINFDETNIDDIFEELEDYDAEMDFRQSGEETTIECEWSRHYESKSVARKLQHGPWVGWTYWYGGGKHGEPETIDWLSNAYFLEVVEKEVLTTVREFTRKEVLL